jgi:hypothetical protein
MPDLLDDKDLRSQLGGGTHFGSGKNQVLTAKRSALH